MSQSKLSYETSNSYVKHPLLKLPKQKTTFKSKPKNNVYTRKQEKQHIISKGTLKYVQGNKKAKIRNTSTCHANFKIFPNFSLANKQMVILNSQSWSRENGQSIHFTIVRYYRYWYKTQWKIQFSTTTENHWRKRRFYTNFRKTHTYMPCTYRLIKLNLLIPGSVIIVKIVSRL